jgi:hypothetical protein
VYIYVSCSTKQVTAVPPITLMAPPIGLSSTAPVAAVVAVVAVAASVPREIIKTTTRTQQQKKADDVEDLSSGSGVDDHNNYAIV